MERRLRDPHRTAGSIDATHHWLGCSVARCSFAGTHNSMSAAADPGWFFAAQSKGINAQLDYGIRAFLIDTHYGVPNSRGHIQTDLSFEGKKRANLVQQLGEP
ncbi:MAG TPA: hypothetical protein VF221_23030, partial [Chloroflexota bacterium]